MSSVWWMKKVPMMKLAIGKHLAGKELFFGLKSHIEDLLEEDNHLILLINFIRPIHSYVDVYHHISSAETIQLKETRV